MPWPGNIPISDIVNCQVALDPKGAPRITRSINSPLHILASELLRAARKAAGLTQVEVANLLERPQSFVADVESGQRRLDLIEFLNFSGAIGFDPHEFLDRVIDHAR